MVGTASSGNPNIAIDAAGTQCGPITPEGKRRASQNAFKHGYYAKENQYVINSCRAASKCKFECCAKTYGNKAFDDVPCPWDKAMFNYMMSLAHKYDFDDFDLLIWEVEVVPLALIIARAKRWIKMQGEIVRKPVKDKETGEVHYFEDEHCLSKGLHLAERDLKDWLKMFKLGRNQKNVDPIKMDVAIRLCDETVKDREVLVVDKPSKLAKRAAKRYAKSKSKS